MYLGTNIPIDTAPPVIALVEEIKNSEVGTTLSIRARVHNNKSPTMPHDWQSVVVRWTADSQTRELPMIWYGEFLWRAEIETPSAETLTYRICATDAAGNESCSSPVTVTVQ